MTANFDLIDADTLFRVRGTTRSNYAKFISVVTFQILSWWKIQKCEKKVDLPKNLTSLGVHIARTASDIAALPRAASSMQFHRHSPGWARNYQHSNCGKTREPSDAESSPFAPHHITWTGRCSIGFRSPTDLCPLWDVNGCWMGFNAIIKTFLYFLRCSPNRTEKLRKLNRTEIKLRKIREIVWSC